MWDVTKDLPAIRREFPTLSRSVYLISNSLGAVPKQTRDRLAEFYRIWAEEGVSAWEKVWWQLSLEVGNAVGSLIGAGKGEVTMLTSATVGHWVALSTKFLPEPGKRTKVVITDLEFPSEMYAIHQIAKCMGWRVETVKSKGRVIVDAEEIIQKIDKKTLFVMTSHVYFKSAAIQDIQPIARRAREMGALTLIDGYHAPGTYPVDVKRLDVDFYIGGCLKWLCGGPGNAFLYVRPQTAFHLRPVLTGWFAHEQPFLFSSKMRLSKTSYRFMAGTPPIPCLYTAQPGLSIIKKIRISQVRKKSVHQTATIIAKAGERGFQVFAAENEERRGGAVSLILPSAFSVKQALDRRGIKVDFRKGLGAEKDVIRVGPHFYTKDEEIDILFKEIDAIYRTGEHRKHIHKRSLVT